MEVEKIKINQIDEIEKFIQDFSQRLSHDLAKQAEEDMIEAHKNIVKDFYDSYNPTSYKRRKVLYDSLISHKYYTVFNKNRYRAKIEVGSSNMLSHYNTDPSDVFDLFWKGLRGLPIQGKKPLTHDVNWRGHRWSKGEHWRNPYWDLDKYQNVFKTNMYGELDNDVTPQWAMHNFIQQWGKKHGQKECEQIVNKIVK